MDTIIIPLVIGVTEVAKQSGLPSKYSALFSIAFAVGATYLLAVSDPLVTGLLYGLSAPGLYSGAKSIIK